MFQQKTIIVWVFPQMAEIHGTGLIPFYLFVRKDHTNEEVKRDNTLVQYDLK